MSYKIFDQLTNILEEKANPGNYISEFVINYYLSRKLKNHSFSEICESFSGENIQNYLYDTYQDSNNFFKKFENFPDLSLDEIIDIIAKLSDFSGLRSGENSTVKSIIDLSLEILDLKKDDKFLDVGSGVGTTLLKASEICKISGIERSPENYIISCLLLDLFNIYSDNIQHNDVFTFDLAEFSANKVFMNMPISLKVSKSKLDEVLSLKFGQSDFRNLIRSLDSSWTFALDIIENTKYEKFVMLINGSPLYSEAHKDIRKILINRGKIEAVIALPANLLPYTGIPMFLLVFSHNNKNIKFVNATQLYSETRIRNIIENKHIKEIVSALKEDSKISKTADIKKIEEEDFTLDQLRYTMPEFPFDASITLKDVLITINRGYTIQKDELEEMTSVLPTKYQYLMQQHFQDGILEENIPYLKSLDKSYDKYLLKENCIIISRLSPFKIGTVDELKTEVLVNGNFFFLEIDESKINKNFLAAYLQSRIGLREIEKYTKGSVMKTISIKDLEKIKIPKISMEKQVEIGEHFIYLNLELKAVKKRVNEITEEKLNMFVGGI